MAGPATQAELDLIMQLRERFREELSARQREGRLHPCFFGDTALCRVLRGNNGELEASASWLERFLEKMVEYSIDDLVVELEARLDGQSGPADVSLLPHYEEIQDYFRFVFQAPRSSPDGDLVQYVPYIDQDKYGILEGLEWERWVRFSRAIIVLLCLKLEELSRAQRRMTRCVLIVDLEGCTMDQMLCGTFDNANDRDVSKVLEHIAAEIVGEVYVVNAPQAVTTLFNTFKVFIPAKFLAKFSFPSGNGLDDADFVERAGGEEQLRRLYATRVGLVARANRSHSTATYELDALPTEKELQSVAKLRERFQEAFVARESAGLLYPCFFGDIGITRVLRGNEGSLSESIKWFERFIDKANQYGIDRHYEHVTQKLDESGSQYGNLTMLPHYEEVQDYCRMVFTAPRPTPKGDVVQYIALADIDRQGILENVDWSHWVAFMRSYMILRCIEAERLSRLRRRMVRCITIFDLEDSGMGMKGLPSVAEFDEPHARDVFQFMQHICAEILGPNYVLNAPWAMVKAYNWFKKFVPEKLSRKLRLLDGDGRSDPEFVEAVGGEAQLKMLLATRMGLTSGQINKPSGIQDIPPGHDFQKSCNVSAGQRVSWSYEVLPGFTDQLLGSSSVEFGVTGYWIGEDPSSRSGSRHPRLLEEIVPKQVVDPHRGLVTGTCRSARNGVITLKWSNYGSMMRSTVIWYSVSVSDGDGCDDLPGSATAASSIAPVVARGDGQGPEVGEQFQYYRLTPTKTRSGGSCCQLCALRFRSCGGELQMALAAASNPGGCTLPNVSAERAIDGELNAKWTDIAQGPLVLKFPSPVHVDEISFTTAADLPECDPVRWVLEGSQNGSTWTLLHSQAVDFPMPAERLATSFWLRLAFAEPWQLGARGAQGQLGGSQSFQAFRFTPRRLRSDSADAVQVSELKFRTATGSVISMDDATVSNPGGLCEEGMGPRKLVDGCQQTAWRDRNKMAILVQFPCFMRLAEFSFTTAQDQPECDPVQWTLEGARSGGAWTVLHSELDADCTPTRRSSSTVWFALVAAEPSVGAPPCAWVPRMRFEEWQRGVPLLSWQEFCSAIGPASASLRPWEHFGGAAWAAAALGAVLLWCSLTALGLWGRPALSLAMTLGCCLALHAAMMRGRLPLAPLHKEAQARDAQ